MLSYVCLTDGFYWGAYVRWHPHFSVSPVRELSRVLFCFLWLAVAFSGVWASWLLMEDKHFMASWPSVPAGKALPLIVLLLLRLRIRIHSITFLRTLSTKGTAHKASKFRPNEQALPSDGNPPTLFSFIRNCSPGHSIRPSLSPHTCSKPSSRRSQDSEGHAVSTPSKCPASIKTDSPMTSPPIFHTLHGGQGVVISWTAA